ncbi:MAG: hypothetical protein R2729_23570 [Bryobacteraceae bacterium]
MRFGLLALFVAAACAQQPSELPAVWEHATPGALPQAIAKDPSRDVLYIALKNGGLRILEIEGTNQTVAANIGRFRFGGLDVMNLVQRENLLYLALGDFFSARGSKVGVAVVDVAQTRSPKIVALWRSDETLRGSAAVAVDGPFVYLAAMDQGVFVFSFDGYELEEAARFLPDIDFPRPNPNRTQHPNARGLAVSADLLYVAFDAGGMRVVDKSDPYHLREVGRYINAGMRGKQQAYNNLAIEGDIVYAAVDYAGLEVLDVSDPARIRQVGWWNPWGADTFGNLWLNSRGHTNQIQLDREKSVAYLSAGDSELVCVDVSDPARPRLAAFHGQPGDGYGAWGVGLGENLAYVAYINAAAPFRGRWSGIRAVRR